MNHQHYTVLVYDNEASGWVQDKDFICKTMPRGLHYPARSREKAQAFAGARGLTLHVVDLAAEYGATVPERVRDAQRARGRSPCSLCGLVKRHEMNRVAQNGGFTVLATGHNLDDEAATLLGNTLRWQTGYLARQAPVLSSDDGFIRKVKPFCRLAERETAAYALLQGIDYIRDECPYAEHAPSLFYKAAVERAGGAQPGGLAELLPGVPQGPGAGSDPVSRASTSAHGPVRALWPADHGRGCARAVREAFPGSLNEVSLEKPPWGWLSRICVGWVPGQDPPVKLVSCQASEVGEQMICAGH